MRRLHKVLGFPKFHTAIQQILNLPSTQSSQRANKPPASTPSPFYRLFAFPLLGAIHKKTTVHPALDCFALRYENGIIDAVPGKANRPSPCYQNLPIQAPKNPTLSLPRTHDTNPRSPCLSPLHLPLIPTHNPSPSIPSAIPPTSPLSPSFPLPRPVTSRPPHTLSTLLSSHRIPRPPNARRSAGGYQPSRPSKPSIKR